MPQLVKKTPMELFGSNDVAIKPHRFAMRTRWEPDYSKPTNGGWSGQKSRQPFRNGMPAQAQNLANVFNEPVGTHDPQYKERIPRSRVGPYGTVKLPEQWKYKPAKSPIEAANRLMPTREYQRKSDGHKFVLYPDSTDSLFSTQDDSGKSDIKLKKGQLDTDFDFLKEYMED